MINLQGKTAIVTGGAGGIGSSIADALHERGAALVLVGRQAAELNAVVRNLASKDGAKVECSVCDITDHVAVQRMVEGVAQRHGTVDILVNNAGAANTRGGRRIPVVDVDPEQWNTVLEVNLTGAFYCARSAARVMMEQEGGNIINVASASVAIGGIESSVDYIASKAGLIGLTRGLAYELGNFNIKVNSVSPGRIVTNMLGKVSIETGWAQENVPLGRLGTPEDVGKVVAFLASEKADYINGANIDINGGWVIR